MEDNTMHQTPTLTYQNPETSGLMFLLAMPEVFVEYLVDPSGTKLASGKVFKHVAHCGTMAVRCSGDVRVTGFGQDDMLAYLEYVDGYEGENNNI